MKLELKTFQARHEWLIEEKAKINESIESMRNELKNVHRIHGFKSMQKDYVKHNDDDSTVYSADYAQTYGIIGELIDLIFLNFFIQKIFFLFFFHVHVSNGLILCSDVQLLYDNGDKPFDNVKCTVVLQTYEK